MKTHTHPYLLTKILTVFFVASLACSNGDTVLGTDDNATGEVFNSTICCIDTVNDSSFTAEEIESLYFMAEEEKLARDVYIELFDTWGNKSFYNISKSEQQHVLAVTTLLEKANQSVPSTLTNLGVFENQELQNLYNELIEQGTASLVEALKVGALVEEVDIQDLDLLRETIVSHPSIDQVYLSLREGSENHLRAFVKNLGNQGVSYSPIILTEELYSEIISSN